jgi:hypothetical protein
MPVVVGQAATVQTIEGHLETEQHRLRTGATPNRRVAAALRLIARPKRYAARTRCAARGCTHTCCTCHSQSPVGLATPWACETPACSAVKAPSNRLYLAADSYDVASVALCCDRTDAGVVWYVSSRAEAEGVPATAGARGAVAVSAATRCSSNPSTLWQTSEHQSRTRCAATTGR